MSKMIAIYRRELLYFFNSAVAYAVMAVFVLVAGYFFYNLLGYFNLASIQAMQNPAGAPRTESHRGRDPAVVRQYLHDLDPDHAAADDAASVRRAQIGNGGAVVHVSDIRLGRDPRQVPGDTDGVHGDAVSDHPLPAAAVQVRQPRAGADRHRLPGAVADRRRLYGDGPVLFVAFGQPAGRRRFDVRLRTFVPDHLAWLTPFVSPIAATVLDQFSIVEHFDSFSKGVLDSNDVVYYLNFTAFFLFLSSRVLDSNRWRSGKI